MLSNVKGFYITPVENFENVDIRAWNVLQSVVPVEVGRSSMLFDLELSNAAVGFRMVFQPYWDNFSFYCDV